jgi:hypothetical protein
MPIVVSISSVPSDVGNYSGLIQTVVDTLKDESLEERVPDFIRLFEALANRLLYPIDDETTTTLSATAANEGKISLPDDFKKARSLTYSASGNNVTLKQLGPDDFQARFLGATSGEPEAYCIVNNQLHVGPTPASTYSLSLVYVEGIPNLSPSNQTNWLIENHPDVYFHGTLMYAELDGWNDERSRNFAETTLEIIEQIKFADAQRRNSNIEDVPGTYF